MAVDVDLVYEGGLHCRAVHRPSGAVLTTDAPLDNHGQGATFSPTDLVATALGACLGTIMALAAERNHLDLAGMRIHVQKHMTATGLLRIAKLEAAITVPAAAAARLDAAGRRRLERAAEACPVRQSLLEAIEVAVRFEWGA
jgi:putative redox protein